MRVWGIVQYVAYLVISELTFSCHFNETVTTRANFTEIIKVTHFTVSIQRCFWIEVTIWITTFVVLPWLHVSPDFPLCLNIPIYCFYDFSVCMWALQPYFCLSVRQTQSINTTNNFKKLSLSYLNFNRDISMISNCNQRKYHVIFWQ